MRGHRSFFLGLLCVLAALVACTEGPDGGSASGAWDGLFGDDASSDSGSLSAASCDVDPPGELVVCSGEFDPEVRSSCFIDLGGGRVRKETAQTFIAERGGPPGKLRTVLTLRNHPTPPPPGETWLIEGDLRPLDEEGNIPLHSTAAIASGMLWVRSCDEENVQPGRCLDYREDLEVEMTFTYVDDLIPGQAYALILRTLEPSDLIIGVACHAEGDVYPDGNAWYRTTRLVGAGASEDDFTDTPFVPYARDISFSISVLDGCASGNQPACGIGECRVEVPWCMQGIPIQCEDFIPDPGVEACNGRDDDCDGYIDNWLTGSPEKLRRACYTGPDETRGIGACRDGYEECNASEVDIESWDGICRDQVLPVETGEVCDGIDEDCDGYVDNVAFGDPTVLSRECYTGPEGTEGVGVCVGGIQLCAAPAPGVEGWGICDGEVVPSAEICDGLDNNCDGQIDEGNPGNPALGIVGGAPCTVPGKFGQCAIGTWQCLEGGVLECVSLYEPSPEICDGLDNNCDGFVDNMVEGLPGKLQEVCYDGPEGTAGVGTCHSGITTCDAVEGSGVESWGSCVGQQLPEEEVCDGLDNNCDGFIDNSEPDEPEKLTRSCYTGPAGTLGVGICHGGTETCNAVPASGDESWSICDGEQTPEAEICDGLDNNCDGFIDNSEEGIDEKLRVSCYTGPEGTLNVGTCSAGLMECTAIEGSGMASFGACEGQVLPSEEVCDGLDNNCDGFVDNAQPFEPDLIWQSCYTGPEGTRGVGMCTDGWQFCDAPSEGEEGWGACEGEVLPSAEVCDGLDNNCDGVVDEGDPGGGGECSTGLEGACGPGTYACVAGNVICIPDQAAPEAEICDGIDNDCDGIIDNIPGTADPLEQSCYSGPAGTQGVGVCTGGVNRCIAGEWTQECFGEVVPGAEVCDGLDNDCDGTVDNFYEACYTGPAGTEGVGECSGGNRLCVAGAWGNCEGEVLPSEEVCDGRDNNCDGQVDEHANLVLVECEKQDGVCAGALKPAELCVNGSWDACSDSQYLAHSDDYHPTTEICDGLDNNCNGQVDEFESGGERVLEIAHCEKAEGVCLNAQGNSIEKPANLCMGTNGWALCDDGIYAAHANATWGAGTYNPNVEYCDGLDNNCDGDVDEAIRLQLVQCEKQQGVCSGSMKPAALCQNGSWGACSEAHYSAHSPHYAAVENANHCDGRDNDCDGFIDNRTQGNASKLSRACYDGDPATRNKGQCEDGAQLCNATVPGVESWGVCDGQVLPSEEVCDGRDNSCNGLVDIADPELVIPDCEKTDGVCAGAKKPLSLCLGAQGWAACTDTHYSQHASSQGLTYDPNIEYCDNQDNNCNGEVDEPDSLQQVLCQNPVGGGALKGVCAGALRPKNRCVAGAWQNCTTADFQAHSSLYRVVETVNECDGYDNDCDGLVDNHTYGSSAKLYKTCYTGPEGTRNVGVCREGAETCIATTSTPDVWTGCEGEVHPSPEVCDGLDNDCDGFRDNRPGGGHNTLTRTCYGLGLDHPSVSPSPKGICQTGTNTCSNGNWSTSCAGQVLPQTEICNNLDDNCDGIVDNNSSWRSLCPDLDTPGVAGAVCVSSSSTCYATACSGNYYYAGSSPGSTNNCACHDDDGYSSSPSSATGVGTVSVTSNAVTRTGRVAISDGGGVTSASNSDYFVVTYNLTMDHNRRLRGTPRVRLTSNPGEAFRMRIRPVSANTNMNNSSFQRCNNFSGAANKRAWSTSGTTASGVTAWTHSDNCSRGGTADDNCRTVDYRATGTAHRPTAGAGNWPIGVEVYRVASVQACAQYTVTFDFLESADPSDTPSSVCTTGAASRLQRGTAQSAVYTNTISVGQTLYSPWYHNSANQRILDVNDVPRAPGSAFAHYANEHWYYVSVPLQTVNNRSARHGDLHIRFTLNQGTAYRFTVYGTPNGTASCSSVYTGCGSSLTEFRANCTSAGCATHNQNRGLPANLYIRVFRNTKGSTPAHSRQLYRLAVSR